MEADAEDKRKRRIYLTDHALCVADKYKEKETNFLRYLYQGVSGEEVDCVYNIISTIEDNLIKMEGKLKE